jgi:hypothetical protein
LTEDWFQTAFPKRAVEMPPTLEIELNKKYVITFEEKNPRIVSGGYRRLTPVINIECNSKPHSLYLSHVDLARRIRLLEKEHPDLTGLTISIVKKKGPKRNYLYDVKVLK